LDAGRDDRSDCVNDATSRRRPATRRSAACTRLAARRCTSFRTSRAHPLPTSGTSP